MPRLDRTILITGGCGFIGSNLVRHVLTTRPDLAVINLDALTYSGNPANLRDVAGHPRYRFVRGDINDRALLKTLLPESDAILHLAAESHVDRSVVDAEPFMRTNALGTQTLLTAARAESDRRGAAVRLVYCSTDEVYGSLPLGTPERFTERHPLNPSSPYAASKAAGDLACLAGHRTHGADVVITRCGNNMGPYQLPEKLIPLFACNLLAGEPVPLYADGRHVRDWLHVLDHCDALLAALDRGRAGQIYNVGADSERSNLELTRELIRLTGRDDSLITNAPDRPGHDLRYAIDATKARAELGWAPTRSDWPECLAETLRWYRDNTEWCDAARARLRA
jgi:dTDP-glucose 4,6-dehydratase